MTMTLLLLLLLVSVVVATASASALASAAPLRRATADGAFVPVHRRTGLAKDGLPTKARVARSTSLTSSVPAPIGASLALVASSSSSSEDPVSITFPTPSEAASAGVRDWPQQFKSSGWIEFVPSGGLVTRYVLEGRGRLTIDYYDDAAGRMERVEDGARVYPGTLVEVEGEAKLYWEIDDEKEGMIVLTPGYEEGGKLALAAGFLVVFCAGLIAGSGGF